MNERHVAKLHNSDKQPLNNKCGNAVRKRLLSSHGMVLGMCQRHGALGDAVEDLLEPLAVDGDFLNKNMLISTNRADCYYALRLLFQAVARYTMLFTMVVRCTC